jgi:2-(1,2-epoxy-1,2-dihydrophenyl)acetyl-CoA isomerase
MAGDIRRVIKGRVAEVTIARPHRRNSLLSETSNELFDVLRHIQDDTDVAVLVLRGEGEDFCCGGDVKDMVDTETTVIERLDPKTHGVAILLHEMRPVTVAAIRGGCAGAGLGLAAACDLRVAATDARFNTAFLNVGVPGDMGGPWFLPRLIGAGRARDLFFFPRIFESAEALDIGLVNRVFDAETFEAELARFVDQLEASAPLALRLIKANFVEAERTGLATFIGLESSRIHLLFDSADRREAFSAYVEKRVPDYRGR